MKTFGMIVFLFLFPLVLLSQTVVSADKMNVLYRGLDNPVTIAVAKQPASALEVSATGARISSIGEGKYLVRPGTENTATIRVAVKDETGTVSSTSDFGFRVLPVPAPTPMLAGKNSGTITKAEIKANPVVSVRLEDFLFDGISYQTESFAVSYIRGETIVRDPIKGSRITENIVERILLAENGSKIVIDEIRAKGPDGRSILLPSFVLTLQ